MNIPSNLRRLTPVLVVETIEPALAFWIDRFGFTTTNEVPGDDGRLLFASVEKDGIEIMYQTRASVIAERADAAAELDGHSIVVFVEVVALDAIEAALAGAPIVKPRHRTFYGSEEIYAREPGGNIIGFAQFAPADAG
ncbi:MAG: VOC family protein [Dokdonella sp.]